jgi:hypothetical protein
MTGWAAPNPRRVTLRAGGGLRFGSVPFSGVFSGTLAALGPFSYPPFTVRQQGPDRW